jgi:hypothetical protein
MSVIWAIAFAFITPIVFTIRVVDYGEHRSCESDWSDTSFSMFFTIKFILIFFVPYVVIWISSVKLLLYLNEWRIRTRSGRNFEMCDAAHQARFQKSNENANAAAAAGAASDNPGSKFLVLPTVKYQASSGSGNEPSKDPSSTRNEVALNLISVQSDYDSGLTLANQLETTNEACTCTSSKLTKRSYLDMVRRKAVRLVLAIVLVFLIQWSPLWTFQFIHMFGSSRIAHLHLINAVISIISYTNTVANPILYMLLTYNFKQYLNNNILSSFPKF